MAWFESIVVCQLICNERLVFARLNSSFLVQDLFVHLFNMSQKLVSSGRHEAVFNCYDDCKVVLC